VITVFKNITLAISLMLTSSVVVASDLHWTYDEQSEWGDLTDKSVTTKPPYPYADCSLGQKQSPVDLGTPQLITGTNLLQPKYVQESLSLSNNGHTLKVNLAKSSLAIGNEKYSLFNIIFTPQVSILLMVKRIHWKFTLFMLPRWQISGYWCYGRRRQGKHRISKNS
jgi:carbonic anhydrase